LQERLVQQVLPQLRERLVQQVLLQLQEQRRGQEQRQELLPLFYRKQPKQQQR
jgi:hypothetical protein